MTTTAGNAREKRTLTLFMGPPGAGKTTLRYLERPRLPCWFYDLKVLANGFGRPEGLRWKPAGEIGDEDAATIRARLALKEQITSDLDSWKSFGVEDLDIEDPWLTIIGHARVAGYRVNGVYIDTQKAETIHNRTSRSEETGRLEAVTLEELTARQRAARKRVARNAPRFDSLLLMDNSRELNTGSETQKPERVAHVVNGALRWRTESPPPWSASLLADAACATHALEPATPPEVAAALEMLSDNREGTELRIVTGGPGKTEPRVFLSTVSPRPGLPPGGYPEPAARQTVWSTIMMMGARSLTTFLSDLETAAAARRRAGLEGPLWSKPGCVVGPADAEELAELVEKQQQNHQGQPAR